MDSPELSLADPDDDDPQSDVVFSSFHRAEDLFLEDIFFDNKKLRRFLDRHSAHLGSSLWVSRRFFAPHNTASDHAAVEYDTNHLYDFWTWYGRWLRKELRGKLWMVRSRELAKLANA